MYTTEKIIEKFKSIHGDKYDYSKVDFVKTTTKVCIICPEHGEFWQEPHAHLKGQGCPKCGVDKRSKSKTTTNENFIKKAKEIHGDKYDYSKTNYINNKTKIIIICPIHGEIEITPNAHISEKRGCPKCGNTLKGANFKMSIERFIEKAQKIHGNSYSYKEVSYINNRTPVSIMCPTHGIFKQTPEVHLSGHGCPECANIKRAEKNIMTTSEFIAKAKNIHGDKYDYGKVEYVKYDTPVTIICPEHGEFQQKPYIHLDGSGCQKCAMLFSNYEMELIDYISSIIGEENIIRNDRTILNGNELDVYVPSKKVAFEFDGLYWHSEIKKPNKKYHLQKTMECEKQGIQLIHIFEDEWIYKKDICKSRIKNILGSSTRLYARKCEIVELTNKEANKFFTENHIQGNVAAKIIYGLKYNNEIVSAMSFGNLRKNLGQKSTDGSYELLRFSNKQNMTVIGGASKLFNHFVKQVNPCDIISYADRRWSMGNLYEQLNFNFSHESEPNYFYIIGNERKNRFGFRKDILISKYGCDPSDTEHNFCFNKGWYRIYDCGTKVYKWKKHSN
jgi:hypothetical protein